MAIRKLNNKLETVIKLAVMTPKGNKASSNKSFDFYLSPQGSDATGDGSRTNPWWSFRNIPRNCKVGLLPGTYHTDDYGVKRENNYISTHGLFNVSDGNHVFLNSSLCKNQQDYENYSDDIDYQTAFGVVKCTTIQPVGSQDSVRIVYDDTGHTVSRDIPMFYGEYVIFKDLVIDRINSNNKGWYSGALARSNSAGLMIDNCILNLTNTYALNYHNGCTIEGWRIYRNVVFNETNSLGLVRNYTCTQYIKDCKFIKSTGVEYNYPYSYQTL